MKASVHLPASNPHWPMSAWAGQFQAVINDKPFVANRIMGRSCWRSELRGTPRRRIWKILASGHVARQGTSIGFYIDQTLTPGTYNLVDNFDISVVYHLTPRQVARVYHSRHLQMGSLALLQCDQESRRLRGTFDFGMSSIKFHVTAGTFDLPWIDDPLDGSAQ
ncbi:MAG TPA: hypothetical protein VGC62_18520 [Pseudomonas sp.]|uniref:hypothetical protein n=1 Tax=Pseudomonas sp. TaxID=306 RepID=UPI002ED771FF